jgi:hypothetical protein
MRPRRHPSARTPALRREIQKRSAVGPGRKIADDLGINIKTIAKWKTRVRTADRPMGPKNPTSNVLLPFEEATIVLYRRHMPLTLDETLGRLKTLIPHLTRATLQR